MSFLKSLAGGKMEELSGSEIKEIKDLFTAIDNSNIDKRLRLVKFFWRSTKHVSSEELVGTAGISGEEFEIQFVENTLFLLWKLGMAHRVEFEGKPIKYEPKYIGDHHDHMVCDECGDIIEFEEPELERLQDFVADKYGFTMVRHRVEFYGLCKRCSSKRGNEILLSSAKSGEMLQVLKLNGGGALNKRCASMGIVRNAMIEVLNGNKSGQLIIACAGSRYMLGKGITEKIVVRRFV